MATTTVRVRFFAAARERARTAEHRLTLDGPATVQDVTKALIAAFPDLAPLMRHLRVAVNQDFADPTDMVPDGAEVALIPPVAGGAPAGLFRVVDEPLSLGPVVEAVSRDSQGGLVTFTGVVRDHSKGKRVTRLDYEAYAPMAEKKLAEIGEETRAKWPGTDVAVMHRVGTLKPGELAVVIAVSAPHRKEAFRACEHVIDRLKEDVPIWKKEYAEDGEVWVGLGP